MEEKSTAYTLGFACGIISVFLIVLLIRFICAKILKKKNIKKEYDERQMIMRGQAAMVGFKTFCVWQIFSMIVEAGTGTPVMIPALWHVTGLLIGCSAFAIGCIWKDAYFSQRDKPFAFSIFIVIILVANIFVFFMNGGLKNGRTEEGLLALPYVNIFVSVMLFIILINLVVKHFVDKKTKEE